MFDDAARALEEIEPENMTNVSILNRVRAWKQLSADLARHIVTGLSQRAAGGTRITHAEGFITGEPRLHNMVLL